MILADTSVWIAMFRTGAYKAEIGELVENDQLCTHPFLIAELALGGLPRRQRTLVFLDQLIQLRPVPLVDVRLMIENRRLAGKGIGLIGAHLVASCLFTPVRGYGLSTGTWLASLRRSVSLLALSEPVNHPRLAQRCKSRAQ